MKIKEKTKCCERVRDDTGWHYYQCNKNAVVKRKGKFYCKIHDPEYIKEKNKKNDEKYEKEKCKQCGYHFQYNFYGWCPLCGTIRKN